MTFFDRAAATLRTSVPFTPSTYDVAFPAGAGRTRVTPENVMTLPIAYACTRVVGEDVAKVPLHTYEDLGPKGKEVVKDHEWYDALHHESNEYQTAIEMREMITAFALNRGRGVCEKRKRRVGGTLRRELVPLHPQLVTRDVTADGVLRYKYQDPLKKKERVLLADEVLAVQGFMGVGVLEVARRSFELMLQMQDYATQAYRKGPRHTGVIQRPTDAPKWNGSNREVFQKAVDAYQGGGENEGRPLLLEDGMTWQNASFTMHDAEFLGTLQHTVADGCRWYRVPQHKVQELARSTNNNIEQQSIDYVVDSLMAWAVRWEQAIRRDLLADPYFAEHTLDALLRGDSKSRAESHALYVNAGIKTPDEIRGLENLNPKGGDADELRVALNMDVGNSTTRPDNQGDPLIPRRHADEQLLARLRAFGRDAAMRLVRREIGALTKLAERAAGDQDVWRSGVDQFYAEHVDSVVKVLRVTPEAAEAYCDDRRWRIGSGGPTAIEDDETLPIAELVELAVSHSLLPQPTTTGAAA